MLKRKSNLSQSQVSKVITCLKNLTTWNGGKEKLSIKLLINLNHQRDQLIPHSDFHYKMYTKSLVLELSQSVESKLVSSNQVWLSNSHLLLRPLKLNPSKCIMNNFNKPPQVTTLVSMSKILLLKTSKEDMLPPILITIQLLKLLVSLLKLLFLVILDKSETDILQFLIVTLLTSLVNLKILNKKSTKDPSKSSKKTQISSRLVTVVWSTLYQPNHYVLNHTKSTLHLEDSLSEIWKRLLLLDSSKKLSNMYQKNDQSFLSIYICHIRYF